MLRRDVLSAAAMAGPLGIGQSVDQVDFDAVRDRVRSTDEEDVLEEFELVGSGVSPVQLFTTNSYDHEQGEWMEPDHDHDHGDGDDGHDHEWAVGDDVAVGIHVEHIGELRGWFRGGYRGHNIGLERRFLTPPATVQGTMELIRTDGVTHSTSKYVILWEGVIDECCGKNNFNFEGVFQSIQATNQFAGTMIEGEITSDTQPGAEQVKYKFHGVQKEDHGDDGDDGGHH